MSRFMARLLYASRRNGAVGSLSRHRLSHKDTCDFNIMVNGLDLEKYPIPARAIRHPVQREGGSEGVREGGGERGRRRDMS